MTKQNLCRHCDEAISFIKKDGRWIPVVPGTEKRHVCQLDQICEDCQTEFQGAPWMKRCPKCFSDSRPGRRGFARSAPQAPAKREELPPVEDDFFDDVPF